MQRKGSQETAVQWWGRALVPPQWIYRTIWYVSLSSSTETKAPHSGGGWRLFFFNIYFLFIYLAALGLSCSMWDLVPQPGVEPVPTALGVWSLSHWTPREVLFLCFLSKSSLYWPWISHFFFVFRVICPAKLSRGNTKRFMIFQQLDLAFWPSTRIINSIWQQSEFLSFSYSYTVSKTNVDLKLVILSLWNLFHEGGAHLEIITKFNFSHSKIIYIHIGVVKRVHFYILKIISSKNYILDIIVCSTLQLWKPHKFICSS